MAFLSSFGQTYFIAVFGPEIQQEFGLSHAGWGAIYMAGTLGSALVLPWTGKLIDDVPLPTYTGIVALALGLACLWMALVPGAALLVVAVFGLRQTGQGLSSHVASTSMARYFSADRGRAIAVAALGFSLGEAVLPFVGDQLIDRYGWRTTYAMAAGFQIVCGIPLALWLLRGHAQRHATYLARLADLATGAHQAQWGWRREEVIRDARFWWMLPGLTAPSLVLTGMFFHHLNVADAKDWSHAWITGSYIVYAIAAVVTSLVSGYLVDRMGAIKLVPAMLIPMCVGLALLALADSPWIAWPYLVLIGISTGVTYTALSAMWAELYGTAHLGAIKSLAVAISVLSSGLGPVSIGLLLDIGFSMNAALWCMVGYTLTGSATLYVALRMRPATRPGSD